MPRSWTVPATVERVIDGDTAVLVLDLGWNITLTARCRVLSINAPEMDTQLGKAAQAYAAELLPVGSTVVFHSRSLDKYGRPLGSILTPRGTDFATDMLSAGHAAPMK